MAPIPLGCERGFLQNWAGVPPCSPTAQYALLEVSGEALGGRETRRPLFSSSSGEGLKQPAWTKPWMSHPFYLALFYLGLDQLHLEQ